MKKFEIIKKIVSYSAILAMLEYDRRNSETSLTDCPKITTFALFSLIEVICPIIFEKLFVPDLDYWNNDE